MRLLAASIVILLLAFSLAHAEEYAGGQVVRMFECLKAERGGFELYDAGKYIDSNTKYKIEKAYFVDYGSPQGSIYLVIGQVDIAGNEPLTVRCFNILP